MDEKSYSSINITNPKKKDETKQVNKRTVIELCFVIIAFGIISYLIYEIYNNVKYICLEDSDMCKEPTCYKFVLELDNYLDASVDPCEDFHQFICGGFYENSVIKQMTNPINTITEYAENELTSYITTSIKEDDSHHVVLQKTFFQSCLNLEEMENDENNTLMKLIEEIGGWPLLKGSQWQEDDFNWQSIMIKCKQLGLPFQWFLKLDIYVYNETNYLQISYPDFANYLQNGREYMKNILSRIDKNVTISMTDVDKVLRFEKQLVSCNHDNETLFRNIHDLQEVFPKYDWLNFLNNITEDSFEFKEDTILAFNIHTYIHELDNLLIKTDNRTIANYIMWKIVQHFALFLSPDIQSAHRYFFQLQHLSRFDLCVEVTKVHFPYVSEAEYIRKYSDSKTRKSVEDMTNRIKEELLHGINENAWNEDKGWLTYASWNHYTNQFKDTRIDVGGQEEIFEEKFFDNNYLHIGQLNLTSSHMNMIQMVTERSKSFYESVLTSIGENGINPENIELYHSNIVNVKFDKSHNVIIVPSFLLHGFFYDLNRPQYLNYGILGTLIGEELVKSFLEQLKEDDNTTNIWRFKDYKVYDNGTQCFETDNNLQVEVDNVHSIMQQVTLNIIGRSLVHSAYKKWVETNEQEPTLPFLPYNPNELFWIASSLLNCHEPPLPIETLESQAILSKMKNILSLRHSRYFTNDFSCPVGSQINPEKSAKCWLFL